MLISLGPDIDKYLLLVSENLKADFKAFSYGLRLAGKKEHYVLKEQVVTSVHYLGKELVISLLGKCS